VRGCLSILVVGIALLGAVVWIGGPPLASAVVASALTSRGLAADQLDVQVVGDPPLTLLVGRAARVEIHATGARWHDARVASLDVTLGAVDLLGRRAATAEGRLGGVQLEAETGPPLLADVEISGTADRAQTTIHVRSDAVESVAMSAFGAALGLGPSSASLVAPDQVRVALGPLHVDGTLSVAADGSVVAAANGKTIRLFAPNPTLPLRLTSLSVTASGLDLEGTLDLGALLR
jgi:hypothetical protein